jgi:ATP-dependent DNA helicase DinG
MPLDPLSILGERGRIAERLRNYEVRPQQLQMAEAVAEAIATQSHLLVEAGTGVGKSFAYLVPAILAATARQGESPAPEKRKPIIISTHTISLQEQLISRDIPFLNAVLPVEFSAVLVKGRSNYMSLRRLGVTRERAPVLFAEPEKMQQLGEILQWSSQTTDGSRSDLGFRPQPDVWDEIQSEHGNCLGRNCPTYNDCFYFKARRRVWNADVLVVNHALFFSDLALRREGAQILPDYDVVIFDEAHTVEAVAGDHLGISVSSGQFDYLLNKLYNDRTNRGLLVHHQLREAQQLVSELRFQARDFFYGIQSWLEAHGGSNGRVRRPPEVDVDVSGALVKLGGMLAGAANKEQKEEHRIELTAASDRCLALSAAICGWMKQSLVEGVYWIEASGRQMQRLTLASAPVEVGPALRDQLFNQVKTVILTSATLAVAGQDFDFIKSRLGLTKSGALRLGSPFDYRSQVKLILPQGMPDPGEKPQEYETAVCAMIRKYVLQTQGRAFVLFTSYQMLQNCATRLTRWLAEENLALYSQGDQMPRTLLLEKFRQDPRAVLFGTESFWQGVDVPGEALQNVIITKLPFSVPDQPLLEARLESIRARGGNPFMEYQLPEAIIKLKQGFGRLIRTKTDRGQVVILDPRVQTKRYGKLCLESLPECELVFDSV